MNPRSSQWTRYRNLWRHVRNPGTYLLHKAGLRRRDPLRFDLPGGLRLDVPAERLGEFKGIVMDDAYLKAFRPGCLAPADSATVLDVGANLGFFSVYAMSRLPGSTVLAVEPLPANFAALEANLALNPDHRFRACQAAVSDAPGTLRLFIPKEDAHPTGASIFAPPGGLAPEVEVPAVTLATLCEEAGWTDVDLLKLDCEGAEYAILYACPLDVLDRICHVAMEVHRGPGENEDVASLAAFLAERGFVVCVASDGHYIWAARDPDHLVERTR